MSAARSTALAEETRKWGRHPACLLRPSRQDACSTLRLSRVGNTLKIQPPLFLNQTSRIFQEVGADFSLGRPAALSEMDLSAPTKTKGWQKEPWYPPKVAKSLIFGFKWIKLNGFQRGAGRLKTLGHTGATTRLDAVCYNHGDT